MEKPTEKNAANLKIAITHDYLIEYGGAEMVLKELLRLFPQADLYTALHRPTKKQRDFWAEVEKHKVKTSIANWIPLKKFTWKFFLPLHVAFFRNLDLSKYDVVISSSAGFAKFIETSNKTKHIAYIHTPPRFLWGYDTSVFHKIPGFIRFISKPFLNSWRRLDQKYAKSADKIVANSNYIKSKIKEVYGRGAEVINPPVDIGNLLDQPSKPGDYFITIGRLYDYKKTEIIIRAFNKRNDQLIIIGDGPEKKRLKKIANSNIEFKGFVSEEEKIQLLTESKAFVFAADEDFGIVLVEALAAGKPVIAYKKGGALEIIEDRKNGILFTEQTPESLNMAIDSMTQYAQQFSEEIIKKTAEKFSIEKFRQRITKLI